MSNYFGQLNEIEDEGLYEVIKDDPSSSTARCWPLNQEHKIEFPKPFSGFFSEPIGVITHKDGGEAEGWTRETLTVVPIHIRTSFVTYLSETNKTDPDKKIVSKRYIEGGRSLYELGCLSPDLVDEHGDMLLFVLQVKGMATEHIEKVLGTEGGFKKSSFYQQIYAPINKLVDPTGKFTLHRNFFHIPLRFAKKPISVGKTVKSSIYPIEGDWGDSDYNEINRIKGLLGDVPYSKERKAKAFELIEQSALSRFFGQYKGSIGYADVIAEKKDEIQAYKDELKLYDELRLSDPHAMFIGLCQSLRIKENPIKLLELTCGNNLLTAVETVKSMKAQEQTAINQMMTPPAPAMITVSPSRNDDFWQNAEDEATQTQRMLINQ